MLGAPLPEGPDVALGHLDDLWFQVAGTLCNLECHHCFISCSPHNHTFGMLDLANVKQALKESIALGVKEYYFTGGEPFLNRELVPMLELALHHGPATVLTNGTAFSEDGLARLQHAESRSHFSLEFRVSLDGFTAESNDPIRGQGTFERILRGVRQLLAHDFLPILTVARTTDAVDDAELFSGFLRLLKSLGYHRPRVKILPTLRLGAEVQRQRGYQAEEQVTADMMVGYDTGQLLCQHSRVVTDRGVFVCPILIEKPDARLGLTLADALQPFALRHRACFTCYQYGTICANPSAANHEA